MKKIKHGLENDRGLKYLGKKNLVKNIFGSKKILIKKFLGLKKFFGKRNFD